MPADEFLTLREVATLLKIAQELAGFSMALLTVEARMESIQDPAGALCMIKCVQRFVHVT